MSLHIIFIELQSKNQMLRNASYELREVTDELQQATVKLEADKQGIAVVANHLYRFISKNSLNI